MDDYEIKNHRLYINGEKVQFKRSPNQSGTIKPRVFVEHDTAGHLTPGGSVDWLCNPRAKASAHFVTERDGTVVQLVETNRKAWHAGKSSYRGRAGCNSFSVGNEIVNPGQLTKLGNGKFRSWFGTVYNSTEYSIQHGKAQNGKYSFSGYWMDYTEEQLAANLGIVMACHEAYGLEDVVTHWQISPGRKVDTGPNFPLEQVKARVFGRGDVPEDESFAPANGVNLLTTTLVNARLFPSFYNNVKAVLTEGTTCIYIKSGKYRREGGNPPVICESTTDEWTQVEIEQYPEPLWIMSQYLRNKP